VESQGIVIGLQVLMLVGVLCVFVFRNFLFSYGSEKGKNLATKEDVGEITNRIETVKFEHARQLEAARAELSSQINTHGFRYEKEYEVLSELSSLLVDVRDASISFRPVMDFIDPSKTEEERKKERLTRYYDALRALYYVREKKRPFFPEDIYQSIQMIEKETRSESIEYEYREPSHCERPMDYWDDARKSQARITELAENAMKKIRERVNKWESLSDGL
jgi:hypothetical protein